MRASSPKEMFHLNTNCCHTWLIWMGRLSAVEHCNLLELKCTILCEPQLKMEQVTSALASLETQAVPAMTCVHEQLIFSTVVPYSLPATYYNVSTCKWLCISAQQHHGCLLMDTNPYKSNYILGLWYSQHSQSCMHG